MDAICGFEQEYKTYMKIFENKALHPNWKEDARKMDAIVSRLKSTLFNIEIELMEDSDAIFKKEINAIIEEENKKIQSILSEEQKDEKGEEIGYVSLYEGSSRKSKTKSRTSATSWKRFPRTKSSTTKT